MVPDMSMAVGQRRIKLPVDNLIAIGRSRLLDILRRHAEAAGVGLHYGERVDATAFDVDLVVAADGVNSATRESHAGVFGHRGRRP